MNAFAVSVCGSEVLVAGEICVDTAAQLRDAIAAVSGEHVTVDLRDVTFLGSAGAAVLFHAARRELEIRVTPSSLPAGVLTALGLDQVATVRAIG